MSKVDVKVNNTLSDKIAASRQLISTQPKTSISQDDEKKKTKEEEDKEKEEKLKELEKMKEEIDKKKEEAEKSDKMKKKLEDIRKINDDVVDSDARVKTANEKKEFWKAKAAAIKNATEMEKEERE